MKSQSLHFSVHGPGITRLVRDMYLYEDKVKAWNIMSSLEGITVDQSKAVFEGDAQFENPVPDDGTLNLVYKKDKEWKKKFAEHLKFLVKKEKEQEILREQNNVARELMNDHEYLDFEEAIWAVQQAYKNKNSIRPLYDRAQQLLVQRKVIEMQRDKEEYEAEVEETNSLVESTLEKLQKEANLAIAKALFIQGSTETDPESRKQTQELIGRFANKQYSFDFDGHSYQYKDSARNQGECPHCEAKSPDGFFWRHSDEGYIGYYDFGHGQLDVCFECPHCFEKFYYHYIKNDFLRDLEERR